MTSMISHNKRYKNRTKTSGIMSHNVIMSHKSKYVKNHCHVRSSEGILVDLVISDPSTEGSFRVDVIPSISLSFPPEPDANT
jgi:hypothetical protein